VAVKQVVESGDTRTIGVDSLGWLLQLLRVAEQNHGWRSGRDGDGVGQGELTGLVNDQNIDEAPHVLTRPQPRGATHEVPPCRPTGADDGVVGADNCDLAGVCVVLLFPLLQGRTAHLLEQVADDLV